MISVKPVILCGGVGERLWPLSSRMLPKQFLNLPSGSTLFQKTISRLRTISDPQIHLTLPLIVTAEDYRFTVLSQLNDVRAELFLEPSPKNTAAALTLAAFRSLEIEKDSILMVSPSDHLIVDDVTFNRCAKQAIYLAAENNLVLLGIPPAYPSTEYGYVKHGNEIDDFGAYSVESFFEKPSVDVAKKYLYGGNCFWNSGIFFVKATIWLKLLESLRKDIYTATWQSFQSKSVDGVFFRPNVNFFEKIPSQSIDKAVIENCFGLGVGLKVLPLDVGWSDLGSWSEFMKIFDSDKDGNSLNGDAHAFDALNNYIYGANRKIVAFGVNNLVIVETPNGVLVADKSRANDLKKITTHVRQNINSENLGVQVTRPWGWYMIVDQGPFFKVKRLFIHPYSSLSLQSHKFRAEHWVVVSGVATVKLGAEKLSLHENQSLYIPCQTLHRLENLEEFPLEIIEVQSGDYLGEDDIIRYDDSYGRV